MAREQPIFLTKFKARLFVILARPENPENIGLVARAMKNTGFENLRLVGEGRPRPKSYAAAVHARDILQKASFFPDLASATADLNIIFAATAKARKNFSGLGFDEAVCKVISSPPRARIGLLFGNERTGLTSEELRFSNYRFTIPQSSRQPSYNLASAVLLTLFRIFRCPSEGAVPRARRPAETPLPWAEQEECIRLILRKLEEKRFIHPTNRRHVTEMIHDLLGRLAVTAKDRAFLLALFSEVGEGKKRLPRARAVLPK